MLTFRRLICLLLALGLLTISAVAEMPNPTLDPNANPYDETHPELLEADQLYCTSAILIEQSTGEVIFEKNADLTMYPASTTKIMTVLLGILNSNPDDKVTVSYNGSAAAMRAIDRHQPAGRRRADDAGFALRHADSFRQRRRSSNCGGRRRE